MGWIVFGAVVLAIFLLMISPAVLRFEYGDDMRLRLSWLFVTIFRYPAVTKKNKRRDKKAEKAVKAANSAAEKAAEAESSRADKHSENKAAGASAKSAGEPAAKADKPASGGDNTIKKKPKIADIFEMVKLLLDSLKKPLKKILKRTRIHHLRIYIVCGGEDAAKAAINFGKTNILVGSALGWADSFFTLRPADEINITVDFQSEETRAEASCTIKMPLYAALAFAFTVFGRAVRYYTRHPEAQKALNRLRN